MAEDRGLSCGAVSQTVGPEVSHAGRHSGHADHEGEEVSGVPGT